MKILSLDLGSITGWAMNSDGIHGGVLNLKGGRYEGGGMRFLRFRQWLDALPVIPEVIVYEEVRRHMGTDAAHIYGGLQGQLTAWAEERKIPYEGIPVGTIKKFITGKGNAGKKEVIAGVEKKGFAPEDDNHADALALLLYKMNYTDL